MPSGQADLPGGALHHRSACPIRCTRYNLLVVTLAAHRLARPISLHTRTGKDPRIRNQGLVARLVMLTCLISTALGPSAHPDRRQGRS